MASDWDTYPISDFVTLSQGLAINAKSKYLLEETGLPLLRITDLINGTQVHFVNEEKAPPKCIATDHELIYTRTGQVGLVYRNKVGVVHNNCFKVIPSPELDKDFLYWFLFQESTKAHVNAVASGSVQKDLNHAAFLTLSIPKPELSEQKAIASILDSLDDKIELNRQMNETLEAMAQALFKSWFVDFDPVIDNALAAGNAIPDEFIERAEQRKGIEKKDNSEIQSLFPDEFEFTEEMGWIPKGWEVENLDKKIDVLNGFAFKSKDYVEKGLFVLRTKNFTSERSVEILGDDVYLPNEFENTFSKYLSEPFDYHLVMVGASVGNRGLIEPHQLPALRNQNMWCFRPKPNAQISRSYVKYMLDFVTPQKLGLASGSAREFFRKGDFQKHQLCLPSNATLNKFDQIAFSYLKKKAQNNSENVSLSKLRDTLLPKLMSGEIRIPDAAAFVENI